MFAGFAAIGTKTFVAGWLTFELTGSFTALGILHLAAGSSSLLTSLPAGVIADRVKNRKRFIQTGQAAGAVASLGMGLIVASGELQFWHVAVGAALLGATHSLTMPARQSLTPSVVGMERLTNAMALYTSGQNSAFLLMPALAGWMIGALGPEGSVEGAQYVYYLMTLLYVGAVLLLLPVKIGPRAVTSSGRALSQLTAGIRYVTKDPIMRPLLAYNAAVALFWMTYAALLPGYAKNILDVGAGSLGILLSASGLGAVAGALIVASFPTQHRGRIWLLSVMVISISMLAFSLTSIYWVALCIAVAIGFGQAGYLALGSVLLQTYVEEGYRGRILSIYMMQFGLMSLGTLVVSLVANAVGAQVAVGFSAVILLLITAPLLAFGSPLSRLR
jgi:MFS family permease